MFIFLTQNINVSIAKCISMNVACIALDHLQVAAAISAVLTYIRQNQLCTITGQTNPLWQLVCCNTYSINALITN